MLSHIVAIVTGGSSGLGAATAKHLIRNGARVCVIDLASQQDTFINWAQQYSSEITLYDSVSHETINSKRFNATIFDQNNETYPLLRSGSCLTYAAADVTDSDQVIRSLDHVERIYGEPINTAVSCAGIAFAKKTLSKKGPHPVEDFTKTVMINMIGTFNVGRLAAERISQCVRDNDGLTGCIINTASIAAFEGQIGQVAYAASKAGVVGMTLPMARDLASYGIRVVTIAPGLFETPLLSNLPQNVKDELGMSVPCPSRLGKPDEFGQLVGSILENKMLNGTVIRLDGALRMPP